MPDAAHEVRHKEHRGEEVAELDHRGVDLEQILVVSRHFVQLEDAKELEQPHQLETTENGQCLCQ